MSSNKSKSQKVENKVELDSIYKENELLALKAEVEALKAEKEKAEPDFSNVKRNRSTHRVSRRSIARGPLKMKPGHGDPSKKYYFPTEDELPGILELGYKVTDMTKDSNSGLHKGVGTGALSEGVQQMGSRLVRTLSGCKERHVLVEMPIEDYNAAMDEYADMRNEMLEERMSKLEKDELRQGKE